MTPTRPSVRRRQRLQLDVLAQPDALTCGPTCLHAIYRYYGDPVGLDEVIAGVTMLPSGGTLAVWLGCDALRRGYDATIYTYNLTLFDPTWFRGRASEMPKRLEAQQRAKTDEKLALATRAYLEFFALGGRLRYEELTADLIRRPLKQHVPVLAGLSATYLYGCARERDDEYDDIGGEPAGHFVVVSGYSPRRREVVVADPLHDNPRFGSHSYRVSIPRLIGAVLLGVVTYDANLLVIRRRTGAPSPGR